MQTINILGTTYILKFVDEIKNENGQELSREIDYTTKNIKISRKCLFKETTIRHELIHAFLYESGLHGSAWSDNEDMIDWFANQMPKIEIVEESIDLNSF